MQQRQDDLVPLECLRVHRTRIKFCGITRPADAIAAAQAGADAIGLIFYQRSPRCVTVPQAQKIIESLPPMVTPIGLFVNHAPTEVRKIAMELNLNTVQLHGDESLEFLSELPGYRVIKAVRCNPKSFVDTLEKWARTSISALLLETANTVEPGGTGVENDWAHIKASLQSVPSMRLPPLIAAGGLRAENVGQVVKWIYPWAVDVSTGIEESKGIKSVEKMQKFARAVREADRTLGQ